MEKASKREGIILLGLFILFCGCVHQQPLIIEESRIPRVVIKEVYIDSNKRVAFDPNMAEDSYLLPDLTKGYIKNEAYPLTIRVWRLDKTGKKTIILGSDGKIPSPLNFYFGSVREFDFPPNEHRFIIERWKFYRHYGGWRKNSKDEIIKLEVGRIPRGTWHSRTEIGHYNWAIVIGPGRSQVYQEGQVP